MIGTFNDALSMLEIWFFNESMMAPGYTSLTHDGKDLSSSTMQLPSIEHPPLVRKSFLHEER
jgi:hypothetical protein